jgi:hypothetical protein
MTDRPGQDEPVGTDGGRAAVNGTPVAVDVSHDRLTRIGWVVLLGGPVIWFSHFMLVYLVAEAGCTGGGPGLRGFNPPVPAAVTLAATALAALGCLAFAAWAYRRWLASRDGDAADNPGRLAGPYDEHHRGGTLALTSLLLALFSFVAVLFVGAPALVFEC